MNITKNEHLNELLARYDEKKEAYASRLNDLHAEYDPMLAKLKRERGNRLYGMGWAISVLVIITFFVAFRAIVAENLIYLLYGIGLALLIYSLVLVFRSVSKLKDIQDEWNKKYEKISVFRDEAVMAHEQVRDEAFEVMSYNDGVPAEELKTRVYSQIGFDATSEDVMKYYEAWGKAKTGQLDQDFEEFLENRRRKAELLASKEDQKKSE